MPIFAGAAAPCKSVHAALKCTFVFANQQLRTNHTHGEGLLELPIMSFVAYR